MIPNQLPVFPVYRAGGAMHATLRGAIGALDEVIANPGHALIRRPDEKQNYPEYEKRSNEILAGTYERPTLVEGVSALVPHQGEEVLAMLRSTPGKERIGPRELAQRAVAALAAHLAAQWNSEARHVIFLSSGYDSRLVAMILRSLWQKRGDAWLGSCRFCSFRPEIDYAKRIYDRLDFPEEFWFPIAPSAGPVDYYAPTLKFETAGRELTEAERFWGGPFLTQLALGDYVNTDRGQVQGLSALFSDETCKWSRRNWGNLAWFVACYFFDNPNILPSRPGANFILPFAALPWLEVVTRYRLPDFADYDADIRERVVGKSAIDAFKLQMIRTLDDGFLDLPNFRFEVRAIRERNAPDGNARHGHIDEQKISGGIAQAMENAYRESWYAQSVGPATLDYQNDRSFDYYSDRNTHYLKAAIYDAIQRDGIGFRA